MVCLTTFSDTKRVISHSLIIFHIFYGYVQGWVPPQRIILPYLSHTLFARPFSNKIKLSHFFSVSLPLKKPLQSDTHTLVVLTSSSHNHLLLIELETNLHFLNVGKLEGKWCDTKNIFSSMKRISKKRSTISVGGPGTVNYGTLTSLC